MIRRPCPHVNRIKDIASGGGRTILPDFDPSGLSCFVAPSLWRGLVLAAALAVAACAPAALPLGPGPAPAAPQLAQEEMVTADGLRLPLRSWLPSPPWRGPPKAVVVAVHGMNDYGNAFANPARIWAGQGIATYAYDQRGFGGAPGRGLWHGAPALTADLQDMVALIHARHPGLPLFVLGESMGAAVAILALTDPARPDAAPLVAGLILSAPAVGPWRGPAWQRVLLGLVKDLLPGLTVGRPALASSATDDMAVLEAMAADPMVLKETRIDSLVGIGAMMGAAGEAAERLSMPVLVLHGGRDTYIPAQEVAEMVGHIARSGRPPVVAYYEEGRHLLMRDRQAQLVIADIGAWIANPAAPLPSAAGWGGGRRVARN